MLRSKVVLPQIYTFQVPRMRTRVPQAVIDETIMGLCREDGNPEALRRFKEIVDFSGSAEARAIVAAIKARGDQTYWECKKLAKQVLAVYLLKFLEQEGQPFSVKAHIISGIITMSALDENAARLEELALACHLKTCSTCQNKKQEMESIAKGIIEKLQDPKSDYFDMSEIPNSAFRKLFFMCVELLNQSPQYYLDQIISFYEGILRKDRYLRSDNPSKRRAALIKAIDRKPNLTELYPGLRVRYLLSSSNQPRGVDLNSGDDVRKYKRSVRDPNIFLTEKNVFDLLVLMQLPTELIRVLHPNNFV